MRTVNSIEKVKREFQTKGSHPILVHCDDFQDWVCKYQEEPKTLFNEVLASTFAKAWNIKTPEIAYVKIKKEHITDVARPIPYALIQKECFGSLFIADALHVDNSIIPLIQSLNRKNKSQLREDLLKIALFDIWLSNEDRTHNNYNLLLVKNGSNYHFLCAIDHMNIFNSSVLGHGIYSLNENDTVLNSDLGKALKINTNLKPIVDKLSNNAYLCIKECEQKLKETIEKVPDSWTFDKEKLEVQINKSIFNKKWISETQHTFKTFVKQFILK